MSLYFAIVISVLVLALISYGFIMLAIVNSVAESSSAMSESVSSISQNQSDLCSQMAFQICTAKDEQVELVEAMHENGNTPQQPSIRPMVVPDMEDERY